MASPYAMGTEGGNPFISKHADVTSELIQITLGKQFDQANFKVTYNLFIHQNGPQIPLLFYAAQYEGNFEVYIDGRPVELLPVPEIYETLEGTEFEEFDLFKTTDWSDKPVVQMTDEDGGYYVSIDELHYFKLDLDSGMHAIQVKYHAYPWSDRSGWVRKYHYRYVLSPIKEWRSFGELRIQLNNPHGTGPIETNLGEPSGRLDSIAEWTFSDLPVNMMMISYTPEISSLARLAIKITPVGFGGIVFILLFPFHLLWVRAYRINHPDTRFNLVAIGGAFVIPFVVLFSFLYAFTLIDALIGPEAGNYHGYPFVYLVSYPGYVILYGFIIWIFSKIFFRN